MTHPASRRLLLVADDATPRGSAAPIRRYRLGRVLMGSQELIGDQELRTTSSSRPERMRPTYFSESEPALK